MADELIYGPPPEERIKAIVGSKVIKAQAIKTESGDYEYDDRFHVNKEPTFWDARTIPEMVQVMEKDPKIELEAKVLHVHKENNISQIVLKKMDKKQFIETVKSPELRGTTKEKSTFKESDLFATDAYGYSQVNAGKVGDDFIPLLGGPFNKQLYYFDYLKMHANAFYASNHDPVAHFITNILCDFVLGRGFRLDVVDGKDKEVAKVTWELFSDVNKLQEEKAHQLCRELSIYGEVMPWWLPNLQTKVSYQDGKKQAPPRGLIPRINLIDPSCIWEIVTYPEDISRPLYYQWIAPTQYQLYGGMDNGEYVPTQKFIYQQVPADQIQHYKINVASNEKRGRSDYFPILGYLKRLRDSVNYSIISDQKNSAWSIDTTIDGDQNDIDAYSADQQAMGTIPPAGSEFVHTKAVERQYLANAGVSRGTSNSFEWCLSMIAIGSGVPVSYFGSHLSGGQTRASAMVSTEPFAKRIETRQQIMSRIFKDMFYRLMKLYSLDAVCEITFPEIVVQDRSAKLRDLSIAYAQKWLSRENCATIAAKELGIDEFNWEEQKQKIDTDPVEKEFTAPLSTPGKVSSGGQGAQLSTGDAEKRTTGEKISGEMRRGLDLGRGA